MQIVKFGQKLDTPLTLALGYFETMHLGHTALINQAKLVAADDGSKVAIFTFDRKSTKEVFTFDERMCLYERCGVDYVIVATFDKQFAATKGAEFFAKLNDLLNVKTFVCGFDYTFGNDRLDNFDLTRLIDGKQRLFVCKQVSLDGQKVCSSAVRSLLAANDIKQVNKLLGRPYFISGKVCHGRGVGKTMGFPTANICVPSDKILPQGVFCGQTDIDGVAYPVIVNIGGKPTFDIADTTVEVHVVGYVGDLYGKNLTVELTDFIRDITKFDNQRQLAEQLTKDVDYAKQRFTHQGEKHLD